MKKINKSSIPNALLNYSNTNKTYTWTAFRKNKRSYIRVKTQIFKDQGGICAYCEQDFSCSQGDDDYITQMIEHFHPKRDIGSNTNWALDWNNLLGCCTGGKESNKITFPTPENLSCDQYKEIALPGINNVEGYLINPIDMPAFPCLFKLNQVTGHILANEKNCEKVSFNINNFKTTIELVDNTIRALNLNCVRLLQKRKAHIKNYNNLIDIAKKNKNSAIFQQLCNRFLAKKNDKYHSFFTTYRILLSSHAENYLQINNFSG